MTVKANNCKLSIKDNEGNWVEIKQIKEVEFKNKYEKHFNKFRVEGSFKLDSFEILNYAPLYICVIFDEEFEQLPHCVYLDKDLGWLGYYNVFCSRTEWENQGGE